MGSERYILADGLTSDDLRLIHDLAERMIAAGSWERVEFCASESAETVRAYRPDLAEPVCVIGRHFGGLYLVDDHKSGRISLGTTLVLALNQHARVAPPDSAALPGPTGL